MKQIIFLIILLGTRLNAQHISVELNKHNKLYIGIENELNVAISGIPAKQILVWADENDKDKVTIKGSSGKYKISVYTNLEWVEIHIGTMRSGKKVSLKKRRFIVREIPVPPIVLGGLGAGSYSPVQIRVNVGGGVRFTGNGFVFEPHYYKVKSYRITHITEDDFRIYDCVDSVKSEFHNTIILENDLVYIDNITVAIKGFERKAEPVLIKAWGNGGYNYYDVEKVSESKSSDSDTLEISLVDLRVNNHKNDEFILRRVSNRSDKPISYQKLFRTYSGNLMLFHEQWQGNDLIYKDKFFRNGNIEYQIRISPGVGGTFKSFYKEGGIHLQGSLLEGPCIEDDSAIAYELRENLTSSMAGYDSGFYISRTQLPLSMINPASEWVGYHKDGKLHFKGSYSYQKTDIKYDYQDDLDPTVFHDTTYQNCYLIIRAGTWYFYSPDGIINVEIRYDNLGKEIYRKTSRKIYRH